MSDQPISLKVLYDIMRYAQEQVDHYRLALAADREGLGKATATYEKRKSSVRAELLKYDHESLPQWARNIVGGADWDFRKEPT